MRLLPSKLCYNLGPVYLTKAIPITAKTNHEEYKQTLFKMVQTHTASFLFQNENIVKRPVSKFFINMSNLKWLVYKNIYFKI